MVPHHSTRQAQPCLTSEFGWDPVYPEWYDRMMVREETLSTYKIKDVRYKSKNTPPAGLEPATFGLEVRRAIHCAMEAIKRDTTLVGLEPTTARFEV